VTTQLQQINVYCYIKPNSFDSLLIENLVFVLPGRISEFSERFCACSHKLLKATVSFVMSVCPSVVAEQLGSNCKNSHEILYLSDYRIFFIELNRLCTTQLTVVFYNWLHQQHVSALLGHHQAYKD